MLKELIVKNFAIIEDAVISFRDGLTVLTGETGAGKSLIIDSIDLLLGERANSELIRNGEDKAIIEGKFSIDNKRLIATLNKLDIEYDDLLIINRTITNNKNLIKVNNKSISLNELKLIAKYLADIHQQFDMIKLLNKENYFDIVDGFKYDSINEYKSRYLSLLEQLKLEEKKYLQLESQINDIKAKRDVYEYEYKELTELNLNIDEEDNINNEISLLKNYDKIYDLLLETKSYIDKDSLADIYQIKLNLEKLAKYQDEYHSFADTLANYYYELDDLFENIKKKFKALDYDPNRLDKLEERRSSINIVKKKYNKSVEELINYIEELKSLLQSDEDLDIALKEEKEIFTALYDKTYDAALDLNKIRKETSLNIEKELMKNLEDLGLRNNFKIALDYVKKPLNLDTSIFLNNGIDDIDFYIETNVGEGLKPLAKIASGGEISRIMLALKALFIKSQKISTVIFDEIDTGISGEIARKVALKIKEISLSTQVIIITHLPQVASLSNNHIRISKEVRNNRTYTYIKELNLDEKIYEVAKLISGDKVTSKQLEYAKELILNND